MGHVTTKDEVNLYFEESGTGTPVIFIHEYAGDYRSWEPQVRYFSRRYRCITYNARGYPPSDVPENPDAYGQDMARTDALAILDHLGIDRAHIVGLSMGGFAALHFGFHHADRAHSLVVAGCGYGAEPDKRAQFKTEANATADGIERDTMAVYGQVYGTGLPGCSTKTKIHGASMSSLINSVNIQPWGPPIQCEASRRADHHFTTFRTRCENWSCQPSS